MMFTAPNGGKVRCESNRRFWVVQQFTHQIGPAANVVKRTDNKVTAEREVHAASGRAIFDSVKKEWL